MCVDDSGDSDFDVPDYMFDESAVEKPNLKGVKPVTKKELFVVSEPGKKVVAIPASINQYLRDYQVFFFLHNPPLLHSSLSPDCKISSVKFSYYSVLPRV